MAVKKMKEEQTLPLNMDADTEQTSSITYANEVIAIIAGLAASEVEGVAGMSSVNGGLLNKNRNVTKGVKVEVGTEEVSVDLFMIIEYGTPIQRAAHDAQEGVKKAIESMTGLHVVRVDVHVTGVSFEKEMNALQAGAGKAVLESGEKTSRQNRVPNRTEEVNNSMAEGASEEMELPRDAGETDNGGDLTKENVASDESLEESTQADA